MMNTKVVILLFFGNIAQASTNLCIDKFVSGFEPIDLKVTTALNLLNRKSETFFIQKGKVIYDEKKLSKKKNEPYCTVEYHPSTFQPYSGMWKKNAIQPSRVHATMGDNREPMISISPRPNSKWVAVTYECIYITDYQQLKDELKPLIDVPCADWGDLLPKSTPKCDTK